MRNWLDHHPSCSRVLLGAGALQALAPWLPELFSRKPGRIRPKVGKEPWRF